MKINPLHAIDFYKAGHAFQYPENTTMVYSNFTARSNKLSNLPDNKDKIVFFGLQFFIKEFLMEIFDEGFFKQPKEKVVSEYKRRMDTSLGVGAVTTDHIEKLHDLGYLPLVISALPEGSRVPMGVPVLTVYNTHDDFYWLVNYIESVMSSYLWKGCTSATTAFWFKDLFTKYAEKTSDQAWFPDFQGHDFSFRGMSGIKDAALSGAAHLTSFTGTDTVPAIDLLEEYYDALEYGGPVGCSVPATEHSVMTSGAQEGEFEMMERLLTKVYPSGIVSVVSDSYDYWKVLTEFLPTLKDKIMHRDGKMVIRPDSGDPVDIICGRMDNITDLSEWNGDEKVFLNEVENILHEKISNETPHGECGGDIEGEFLWNGEVYTVKYSPDWNRYDKQYYYIDNYGGNHTKIVSKRPVSAEDKGTIRLLWETFGGTVNSKGYKELDSHIGTIYGDSITPIRAKTILEKLEKMGFASTNVVFGLGSYVYNHVTRDTYGFAVKATYVEIGNIGKEIFKDPATDTGKTKKSAKGLLKVVKENGEYVLKDKLTKHEWTTAEDDEMKVVFQNGKLVGETNLTEIRERVSKEWNKA